MYGYHISVDGIYTDNFYKQIGEYIEPGPQGVYNNCISWLEK